MSPSKETRQYCAEQVRAVDRQKRTIDIVASDFSLDSYNTRIDQNGWDLEQFKRNPVILACHNDRQFVIAKALPETVRVEGQTLYMRCQFPGEGKHPEADIAFNLYADGFMRGVSVGFMPLEWEDTEEPDERGKPMSVRIYRKSRLLEVSLVAIPSNDNALAVRAAKLNADPAEVRRKTEELEKILLAKPEDGPVTTLRIKDKAVSVRLLDGDLAPFEKEFTKVVGYFENKQPANRAATKVLARFFKMKGAELPAEEVEAWERMLELLETRDPEKPAEEVVATVEVAVEGVKTEDETKEKKEEPVEPKPEETTEEPKEEEKPEETPAEPVKPEEPTEPPSNPAPAAEEAPRPERSRAEAPRTVHISLAALRDLPKVLGAAYAHSAAEALRQGKPVKDLDGVLDDAERKLLASLTHS